MRIDQTLAAGVDVGGTTIKAAVVDVATGELYSEVVSKPTPPALTPAGLAAELSAVLRKLGWSGPIGCALPGVVGSDRLRGAPNLSSAWNAPGSMSAFQGLLGVESVLINDADAVGVAEVKLGREPRPGLTIVLTFGTGIGSALVHDLTLIENSELGELRGRRGTFEQQASGRAVTDFALSPEDWRERAQPFFGRIELLLNPQQWIIGGGLSNSFEEFFDAIEVESPMASAKLGQHSGIVGSALIGHERLSLGLVVE